MVCARGRAEARPYQSWVLHCRVVDRAELQLSLLGVASSLVDAAQEALRLLHQKDRACAFDFAGDFPVHVRRHTRDSTRKDFSAFGNELLEKIGVLVVDSLSRDVDATTGHDAVCSTEIRSAFSGFRFHELFGLPVQCVPAEKRIVFLFF